VFPFQPVSRKTVVKLLLRWLPVQQIEVFAVVLQMAAHAILAIGVLHLNCGVIAMFRRKALRHLFMAIKALKGRSTGAKLMAACAPRGSA